MNPDLPASKGAVLPAALYHILKQPGATKLDDMNFKLSNKYTDEHSMRPLEAVDDKIPNKSNRELKIRKRLGLEVATFALKFFGNGVTLGIQVENILKASRTFELR